MFDDIAKFAALVSTSLNKVDRNTLSSTSSGPANKINVRDFIKPVAQPLPVPPPVAGVVPVIPPPAAIPQPSPAPVVDTATSVTPKITENVSILSNNSIEKVVEHLASIAEELSKINRKLTSVQKYCNENLSNKQDTHSQLHS